MKRFPKKTFFKIIGLMLIALLGYSIAKPKFTPLKVETVAVEKKSITETITASGEVEASQSAALSFTTYGKLTWLAVKENDTVKKGQALASIDKSSLQQSYNVYFIAYQNAVTNLDKAIEAEAVTIATYRDTQATDVINATKAQAKLAVDNARYALETTQANLEIARKSLNDATLTAPFDGTITATNVKIGEQVSATTGTAIELSDLSAFNFKVEISETEIGSIFPNQEAEVTLNAYEDETYRAIMKEVSPTATKDASGNKVFKVTLAFEDSKDLKVGLEGDAKLTTKSKEDVVTVPWEAVVLEGDKEYVYKAENGKAVKTEIKTGVQSEEDYEVVNGLSKGDIIIKNPGDKLKNGQKIKISNG